MEENINPEEERNIPLESTQPTEEAKLETAEESPSVDSAVQKEIEYISLSVNKIKQEIGKVVVGQHKMIELMLAGLFTNGHILVEGVPGIAKTLTSKLMAQTLSADFSRIQFTPDLMPTDILGTSVFNMKESEFTFKKGPIFSNIILIDEINRAPAKTQSALMEVMEEEQVTIDGNTYAMQFPFFVIATQNPVEQEGTYKLPEAQLDRFMFRVIIDYPSAEEETQILMRFKDDFYNKQSTSVSSVLSSEELRRCREITEKVYIKDELVKYIAQIIAYTRNNTDLYLGASPRASLSVLKASKAFAIMKGRSFVIPDDIKDVVYPVLNHRVILSHDREMEGMQIKDVVEDILRKVEIPR